jgi:hypothetical protein
MRILIDANVLMNVRVRTRINGTYGDFGPAYRFMIDPVRAACPLTKLNDIPNQPFLSCNSTRNWGAGNYVHARQVSGANRYQFRFRLPAENFSVIISSNTYFRQLNWTTNPLQAGKTYEVDVRASRDGGATWCGLAGDPWGDVCLLTIGTPPAQGGGQSLVLSEQGAASIHMWPNPNRGDLLWLSIQELPAEVATIAVDIFDLRGQRVMAEVIAMQGGSFSDVLELNGSLANGMYVVTILAGEERITERLVIAR